MQVVCTLAGSDSGGGAGIQADLKTFEAHGVFGTTVITALTAQNTQGVQAVESVSPAFVSAQLQSLLVDFRMAAFKTGMLFDASIIQAVAEGLEPMLLGSARPPLVLDPVMVSTSGHQLLQDDAVAALIQQLFPLATVITPNLAEAERLADRSIRTLEDARHAARLIGKLAPKAFILVKGGHALPTDAPHQRDNLARDLLYRNGEYVVLEQPRVPITDSHGTGCTLAAAITARLALGDDVPTAVRVAKRYITHALTYAPTDVGQGARPLRHSLNQFPWLT
jgi:hydroxymethylpyrimidine kinase/phosphomethylpyrimidine kinase